MLRLGYSLCGVSVHVPLAMWVSSWFSGFFTSQKHAGSWTGSAELFPRRERVGERSHGKNSRPTRTFSCLAPSVPGIGSGSPATLIRIKLLLKINECIYLILNI